MNTKDMTTEELRIACAEKCGWKVTIETPNPFDSSCCRVYQNNMLIKQFYDYDAIEDSIKMEYYPDYEHNMNICMVLMEKIWCIYPLALLTLLGRRECLGYVVEWDFNTDIDRYRKYATGKTPQIAIMRAFLESME